MSSRSYSSPVYRYGFNGQEKDDDVSGTGNTNYAEYWEYDCRLGRRWNLDPKPNPSISNYACFGNNPIWFNDVDGDSAAIHQKQPGAFNAMKSVLDDRFEGAVDFELAGSDNNKLTYTFNDTKISELAKKKNITPKQYKDNLLKSESFKALDEIISSSKVANIDVYKTNDGERIARFGAVQTVDMEDILQFDKEDGLKAIGSFAVLTHELSEAYNFQISQGKPSYWNWETKGRDWGKYNASYNIAHEYALKQQAKVMGVTRVDNGNFTSVYGDDPNGPQQATVSIYNGQAKSQVNIYCKDGKISSKKPE